MVGVSVETVVYYCMDNECIRSSDNCQTGYVFRMLEHGTIIYSLITHIPQV